MKARIFLGDCLDLLKTLPDDSIDSVVTDPPYGLGKPPKPEEVLRAWLDGEKYEAKGGGFMGKKWDAFVPGPRIWSEVYRVMKPGAHAIVFSGTRTIDWMTMACRIAGFEVRDTGVWAYWNGFPKSLSISLAIDKRAGAQREVVGMKKSGIRVPGEMWTDGVRPCIGGGRPIDVPITKPATDLAKKWDGWGTCLKPAWEPWIVLRKPMSQTVVENVLEWGTGASNVQAVRFKPGDPMWPGPQDGPCGWQGAAGFLNASGQGPKNSGEPRTADGRWPTNLVHTPKPSKKEKERGLGRITPMMSHDVTGREAGAPGHENPRSGKRSQGDIHNDHPTVKPVKLMRWLVRMTTPKGGVVLDPFMGSGTTGAAAVGQGFDFLGADLSARYVAIAHEKIRHAAPGIEIDAPKEALEQLKETDTPTLWDMAKTGAHQK